MGNIYIPEKISVGFQDRSDTYTKKLAYVVYYDAKGKLRKEASWNSWRDKKIEPQDFENKPTSGFVLNKKVGGYKSDWNFRQAYVRVYDPRGFEFEVTVPNLLFILENADCIKGKGLDGEFVYAWDGTELFLLPVASPDYQKIVNYSTLVKAPAKVTTKNIVLGGTYLTKGNEKWIYLGRFEKYNDDYYNEKKYGKPMGLHYFFYGGGEYKAISSLSGKFIDIVSEEPDANYAALMEKLEHRQIYSPIDPGKYKYEPVTIHPDNTNYFGGSWRWKDADGRSELVIKIGDEFWDTSGLDISRIYDQNIRAYNDNLFCITKNWRDNSGLMVLLERRYPGITDRFKGVDIDTLNKLNFHKRYKYLANGKIYHG